MRFGVVLSLILAAKAHCEVTPAMPPRDLEWWESGVIYQIYPRSFKDSDGDGVGDLKGIIEKLDYLVYLGIKTVWISPFFRSPMVDFGYDISDFKAIEPLFGTMEDFDLLTKLLHKKGLRLILDFVPNHTSDEHEWFLKSIEKEEPYTDYYVWVDARVENGTRKPPNNWMSEFGDGTTWKWNEKRQQYYLYQFHWRQPDLNFRNPRVVQEMKDILSFWMDKGVDGFRMDAVMALVEDEQLKDEPPSNETSENIKPVYETRLLQVCTRNQPENIDIVKQFRQLLDEYSSKTGTVK